MEENPPHFVSMHPKQQKKGEDIIAYFPDMAETQPEYSTIQKKEGDAIWDEAAMSK